MKIVRTAIMTLALLAACATQPETPEQILARQAFHGVRPDSYGRLQTGGPPNRYCEHSEALMGTQRQSPRGLRRQEHLADQSIANEHLQGNFRALTGSTMHNGWMSGGAVVAIIERGDRRVVFWRVVTEIPYAQVESAAREYCQTRGLGSRAVGQSFACGPVYQPISGQLIEGQNVDIRMQQTYAISAFVCA